MMAAVIAVSLDKRERSECCTDDCPQAMRPLFRRKEVGQTAESERTTGVSKQWTTHSPDVQIPADELMAVVKRYFN